MTECAVWGDFEVDFDALLGRGGMGAVYRGRQISLDRQVAVKVLDTTSAPTEEMERAFLQKFEIESRALARVHDPRIITVFQAGKNDGRCWYAMELIQGVTVEDRLSKKGMFEEPEAARIALDVARALDAAYRSGIVHRDVKPANIFLLDGGGTKLGDFGIARAADAPPTPLTEASVIVGTPTYLSPEQGLGEACDHRSDMYSLGVVLYEMLTERPPFSGVGAMETIYKHASEPPQSPRILNPKITPSMEAVILRCLQKGPADRYQTYADLIGDLDAVVSGRTIASAAAEPPPAQRRHRRVGWIAAAAALCAIAAVALLWPREVAKSPKVSVRVDVPPPPVPAVQPPPPDIPPPKVLPYAVEPGPVASPSREDTLANYMASYAVSQEELGTIRAMWAILERHDGEVRGYDYAPVVAELGKADLKHTPYTRLLLEAHIARLRTADRLKPAFDSGSPLERILCQATHADPKGALAALRERLDPFDEEPELLPHLPGVVQAICLRATDALERQDFATGRKIVEELEGLRELLPENLRYALEPGAALVNELAAAEALAAGDYAVVLAKYERTRAYPRAAGLVYSGFRDRPLSNTIAGAQCILWEPSPRRPLGVEQGRFTYPDSKTKTYVVRSDGETQAIERTFERASEGFSVSLVFEPADASGAWAVAFSRPTGDTHVQVEWGRESLALRCVHDTDSSKDVLLESVGLTGSPTSFVVTVVPVGDLVLVYLSDRLTFKASAKDAPLSNSIKIGVARGGVNISTVETLDAVEEENP